MLSAVVICNSIEDYVRSVFDLYLAGIVHIVLISVIILYSYYTLLIFFLVKNLGIMKAMHTLLIFFTCFLARFLVYAFSYFVILVSLSDFLTLFGYFKI